MSRRTSPKAIAPESNELLRSRLLTWDLLLYEAGSRRRLERHQVVRLLQHVLELLAHDVLQNFAKEEQGLYARVEQDFPELGPLVLELRAEHDSIRRTIQECLEALGQEEAGEPGALSAMGGKLARDLREHLRREEEELIPTAVERWLDAARAEAGRAPQDWK
ncbi:MAG: hemerythrin domain-containing protein [Acidobacteria bacterium]|nr:hemerythrin domain-containing protein [Acidobacteriota bacterium]